MSVTYRQPSGTVGDGWDCPCGMHVRWNTPHTCGSTDPLHTITGHSGTAPARIGWLATLWAWITRHV